mgnify:CR=1 FL=1
MATPREYSARVQSRRGTWVIVLSSIFFAVMAAGLCSDIASGQMSLEQTYSVIAAVLVFDDSTAAIDAATEQRIRLAMRKFAEGRVTIIIAHRLSSLMHADQILFMEDGRIVERGSHLELLARGGRYRSLYDLQVRPEADRMMAGE